MYIDLYMRVLLHFVNQKGISLSRYAFGYEYQKEFIQYMVFWERNFSKFLLVKKDMTTIDFEDLSDIQKDSITTEFMEIVNSHLDKKIGEVHEVI